MGKAKTQEKETAQEMSKKPEPQTEGRDVATGVFRDFFRSRKVKNWKMPKSENKGTVKV